LTGPRARRPAKSPRALAAAVTLAALVAVSAVTGCGLPQATPSGPAPSPTVPDPSFRPTAAPEGLPRASVARVVDGDTLDVTPGGRVRLIGIDTPESVDPRQPVQCYGREASVAAGSLLNGRAVLLEADPSQDDKDAFDRLLRFVWLADGPHAGRLVNFELIARGFAHEYTFRTPYKYRDLFRQAQDHARRHTLGLWSPTTCAGNTNRPARTPIRAR
jgi:micrococcal nuclease